ncbi:unnamed protein product [Calypogeia fissa]
MDFVPPGGPGWAGGGQGLVWAIDIKKPVKSRTHSRSQAYGTRGGAGGGDEVVVPNKEGASKKSPIGVATSRVPSLAVPSLFYANPKSACGWWVCLPGWLSERLRRYGTWAE